MMIINRKKKIFVQPPNPLTYSILFYFITSERLKYFRRES